MIFSSLTFLFAYLPLTLAVYFLAPLRWRNLVLLLVSLFFYGWGEPVYIVIMLLSILIDYTHGLLVEKYRDNDKKARWFRSSATVLYFTMGPAMSWGNMVTKAPKSRMFRCTGASCR